MQQIENNYPKNLTKDEAFEVMKICFAKTGEKYLSYGDFRFLLHNKGRIGKTTPKHKKILYMKWKKQFKENTIYTGWKYPFRKFKFNSSRFTEVVNSLINDKKLRKVKGKQKKTVYCLTEEVDKNFIHKSRHKRIINNSSIFDFCTGGRKSMVKYYGVPLTHPPDYIKSYNKTYDYRKKLDKLGIKFEKITKNFLDIAKELTSFILTDLVSEIEKGDFKKLDKKLAFLYLNEYLFLDECKNFIWIYDGDALKYLPKNYVMDSKICDMLQFYLHFEYFWQSKLIVIDPYPDIKQIKHSKKELKNLANIKEKIEKYIEES